MVAEEAACSICRHDPNPIYCRKREGAEKVGWERSIPDHYASTNNRREGKICQEAAGEGTEDKCEGGSSSCRPTFRK